MFTRAIDCDPENGRAYVRNAVLAGEFNDENLFQTFL